MLFQTTHLCSRGMSPLHILYYVGIFSQWCQHAPLWWENQDYLCFLSPPVYSFKMTQHWQYGGIHDPWPFPLVPFKVLPAFFIQHLKDQQARERHSASFGCQLSKPDIPLEWRKGEVGLCPCAKYEMLQVDLIAQLVIHDLDTEDSGDYICSTGEMESTAHLTVNGRQRQFHCTFFAGLFWKRQPTLPTFRECLFSVQAD